MDRIILLTLYGRDWRGTLRLTAGDGLIAEALLPAGRHADALLAVYSDGAETLTPLSPRSFRIARRDMPRAFFLFAGDSAVASAGDRSVPPPRRMPLRPALPVSEERQRSKAGAGMSRPVNAEERSGATVAAGMARPEDAEKQQRADAQYLAVENMRAGTERPAATARAAMAQTRDAEEQQETDVTERPATTIKAGAARQSGSKPRPVSEAGRSVLAAAEALFDTDAAPAGENPFPRAFPYAAWRREPMAGGGWYWLGRDGERTIRAVRSRPAPRPPRHLAGFDMPLRSLDGSFWWVKVE